MNKLFLGFTIAVFTISGLARATTPCQSMFTLVEGQSKTMNISACYQSLQGVKTSVTGMWLPPLRKLNGLSVSKNDPLKLYYDGDGEMPTGGYILRLTVQNATGKTITHNFSFRVTNNQLPPLLVS